MADPKKILAGVGLFAVAVVAIVAGGAVVYYASQNTKTAGTTQQMGNQYMPSTTEQRKVAQTEGFAQLIAFTERGFEPSEPTMLQSERVRFINTSSREVWIEAVGSGDNPAYPGTSECSSSAFDSCRAIAPGEIWEFELEEAGVWLFRNKLNSQDVGLITVQSYEYAN